MSQKKVKPEEWRRTLVKICDVDLSQCRTVPECDEFHGMHGLVFVHSNGKDVYSLMLWCLPEGYFLKPVVCQFTPKLKGFSIRAAPDNKVRLGGRHYSINRLVLTAWVGPPPDAMSVARHMNLDTYDNSVSNLEWASKADVCAGIALYKIMPSGSQHATHRRTAAQKEEFLIRKQIKRYLKQGNDIGVKLETLAMEAKKRNGTMLQATSD